MFPWSTHAESTNCDQNIRRSWAWCVTSVITALRMLRQEDFKFKDSITVRERGWNPKGAGRTEVESHDRRIYPQLSTWETSVQNRTEQKLADSMLQRLNKPLRDGRARAPEFTSPFYAQPIPFIINSGRVILLNWESDVTLSHSWILLSLKVACIWGGDYETSWTRSVGGQRWKSGSGMQSSHLWWRAPSATALRRQRPVDLCKFKACLVYAVRPLMKIKRFRSTVWKLWAYTYTYSWCFKLWDKMTLPKQWAWMKEEADRDYILWYPMSTGT